jgi:ABC-type branched-subunit amino acid transport system substrate-binding protein
MGWKRVAAVVAVLGLAAGACGGGRDDEAGLGTDEPTQTTTAESDEGMFGDLESPCGPGDAAGATDQGVTDTAIQIGYGDDAGFQNAPGLNRELSDAVSAMIDWCNEQGGINGRPIEGTYYDAKITEVNNVMTEACEREFFLVGQGWSLDASQESVRRGCGIPSVHGFAVSPQFANGPMKTEAFPVPADFTVGAPAAQLAELYPDEVDKAAIVYANYSATIDTRDKAISAYPDLGWTFIGCDQEYAITGEADWKPFAQKLKDCGAEMVYFVGSPNPNFRNMLEAADQLDYRPTWLVDTNFYDEAFRDWNTSGFGDDVYMRLSYIPFEEADLNPATARYLELIEAAGGRTSLLGMQSTSAFLLWATAAKACGSDLTRQCVLDELSSVTEWTGGGLHASGNPAENLPTDCGILVKLEGTTFVRSAPAEEGTYECDPSFASPVDGPVVERANLDANRVSQL